jgi:hypothetical protein
MIDHAWLHVCTSMADNNPTKKTLRLTSMADNNPTKKTLRLLYQITRYYDES